MRAVDFLNTDTPIPPFLAETDERDKKKTRALDFLRGDTAFTDTVGPEYGGQNPLLASPGKLQVKTPLVEGMKDVGRSMLGFGKGAVTYDPFGENLYDFQNKLAEKYGQKELAASDRAHGVYGKETAPAWTRGSVNPLKLAYTFQKFSHNYILNMAEMGMKGDRKQFAYMLLSPAVLAGAGASLATPFLQMLLQAFGVGGDDPEEEFYQWAEDTFGTDRMFRHGLAGMMGINLKGSLQIHTPMPRNLKEVLGAPGAIFTDIYDAGGHFRKGELVKGGEKLLPTGIGSGLKAVREYKEGVTTGSYSPVYYGTQPLKGTAMDAVLRFLSFNPSRLSGIREKQWREKKVAAKYAERKEDIYAKIKHAMLSGDGIMPEEWAEIDKLIQRYNEMAAGSGRTDIKQITSKTVSQVIKRAGRPGRKERLRGMEMEQ